MDQDFKHTNDNRVIGSGSGSGGGSGGGGSGDWNELNELTLSVMSNRTRYDKYKKTVANASDILIEQFCKEKMYYKGRIMAMTRDLFDERCENDDINRAHEEYVKSCIEYLKWCDITEMVGEDQRTEVKEEKEIQETPLILQTEELNETTVETKTDTKTETETKTEPAAPAPETNSTITGRIMSFANKMCIRKKTMDDFIVMKPIPGNTDEEINARLPKVRDYQHEIMKRASASAPAHCD